MGELKPLGKPFGISKWEVQDAWEKVKANKGAPGVDEVTLGEFEADLKNNLYKIWNRMSSGSYFPSSVKQWKYGNRMDRVPGFSGCRRNPQTARWRKDREVPESFVTVTHPLHPLCGQRLRVLFERKLPSGLAVSCEGGPLGSVMLPLSWTRSRLRGGGRAADV
jgi:hypothetical protein